MQTSNRGVLQLCPCVSVGSAKESGPRGELSLGCARITAGCAPRAVSGRDLMVSLTEPLLETPSSVCPSASFLHLHQHCPFLTHPDPENPGKEHPARQVVNLTSLVPQGGDFSVRVLVSVTFDRTTSLPDRKVFGFSLWGLSPHLHIYNSTRGPAQEIVRG